MMRIFCLLGLLTSLSAFAQSGEAFLEGRIESRSGNHTIFGKCAVRNEAHDCLGMQFYYSESSDEKGAKLISSKVYSDSNMESMMEKPVLFNIMRTDGEGSNTVDYIEYLNQYEDSWGESRFAKVSYAVGRGICYGVVTPITAGIDLLGYAVGLPVTIVKDTIALIKNGKMKKLMRAMHSGKKLQMDVERLYRLRDSL